jgi:hypothetical protein
LGKQKKKSAVTASYWRNWKVRAGVRELVKVNPERVISDIGWMEDFNT